MYCFNIAKYRSGHIDSFLIEAVCLAACFIQLFFVYGAMRNMRTYYSMAKVCDVCMSGPYGCRNLLISTLQLCAVSMLLLSIFSPFHFHFLNRKFNYLSSVFPISLRFSSSLLIGKRCSAGVLATCSHFFSLIIT